MLTQEQQIFEQIKKASNILITFKKTDGGDAVSSALALFLFLKKLDKNAEIVAEQFESSQLYSFLPAFDRIDNRLENAKKFIISLDTSLTKVSQVKYKKEEDQLNFIITPHDGNFSAEDVKARSGGFKYDLIIVVATSELESLGKIYEQDSDFFYQVPIINIDHSSSNEEFGQINYIKLTAVSTTEILFSLFEGYSRELIDENIATCLLTGLVAKTKSFKTANITPQTLLIASQLISMGARREEIVNQLYRSRSLSVLKLWGRVLAKLAGSSDNKIVWSTLNAVDFAKTGSSENDISDVIDELILNIPQARVILIFYENTGALSQTAPTASTINSQTNVLIYAIKNIDSLELLKEFDIQGTKSLARAVINLPLETAREQVVKLIEKKLSKIEI